MKTIVKATLEKPDRSIEITIALNGLYGALEACSEARRLIRKKKGENLRIEEWQLEENH